MRLAVCDDDKTFLLELEAQLRMYPYVEQVISFSKAAPFFAALEEHEEFDAVLMDIDWDGKQRGMEYAERLCHTAPHLPVIYITGYNDRFSQQILLREANLAGYLTKPVDGDLLGRYLTKVREHQASNRNLTFQQQGRFYSVPTERIVYIESSNHVALIHADNAVYTVYQKLAELLPQLPDAFIQCHKSYLVNLRWVQRVENGRLLMQNGETVRVSRSCAARTREAVFRYLGMQV